MKRALRLLTCLVLSCAATGCTSIAPSSDAPRQVWGVPFKDGSTRILVVGAMDGSIGGQLRETISAAPAGSPIVLISPGGSKAAEQELARALIDNPDNPAVAVLCNSACANAWAQARRRYVSPNATLMFHNARCVIASVCRGEEARVRSEELNRGSGDDIQARDPAFREFLRAKAPGLWTKHETEAEIVLSAQEVVAAGFARLDEASGHSNE